VTPAQADTPPRERAAPTGWAGGRLPQFPEARVTGLDISEARLEPARAKLCDDPRLPLDPYFIGPPVA
jgi:hypothetical protein